MKRRLFLVTSGVGLTVTFVASCALPVIPKRPVPKPEDAMSWIRFAQGRYTLLLPRVEMGQNITTALKQVACEERGILWSQMDVVFHSTSDISRVRATVGSESVKVFAVPLAQACATLRDALAAGQLTGQLTAQPRPVTALRAFAGGAAWKEPRRLVGQAVPLEHGDAIVRGQPLFVADVRRPNMLFGRVLRAPTSPTMSAKLLDANEEAARAVPGFVGLVRDDALKLLQGEGLSVLARTPGALDRIEAALALRWDAAKSFEQADMDEAVDIDRRLAKGSLAQQVHGDTVDQQAPWDVDLRIDTPAAAHAPVQPRAAVAEFNASGDVQVWVGSQDVFYIRDVLAKHLRLDEARIQVQGCRVGGSFGGKTVCTVELEAAVLARAAKTAVKVQWSRAQELRAGFHRPPSSHRVRARLRNGRLVDWWHGFASSHILFTNAVVPAWLHRVTDVIGDDGVARGASSPYRASAKRIEFDLVRLPVLTGPWRGLGAGPNGFAIESAIDECARQARVDQLQFRLDHIDDARLARTLRRVASAAAWRGPPAPAAPTASTASTASTAGPASTTVRTGRGVACGIYKAASYAAVVADVEVNITTGRVRVTRLWCAHDCGQVINPDQVRAQCEGNLVWGIGMALMERLPWAQSGVAAQSFADSPIPRMADVPPMHIVLVDEGEPPTGAGETAIVASAAAIANAIRDATGHRTTRLPLTAQDLLRRHPT
jgi:isoquinoline 1-oxidoreductase subunit beta